MLQMILNRSDNLESSMEKTVLDILDLVLCAHCLALPITVIKVLSMYRCPTHNNLSKPDCWQLQAIQAIRITTR